MNNNYLKEYLDYYKKLNNPGYAILITGEWGSGKTYQIKKLLLSNEMYYISLFGINNQSDIYASVFAKMYPLKGKAKAVTQKISETSVEAGGLTLGLTGLIGGLANAFMKETVNNDRVIVFDDLERCSLKPNEILGVINKYVDQDNCKVIAIAHDQKFSRLFHTTKEKVFGHTIKIESDVEDVFDSFIRENTNTSFLETIKSIILHSFTTSNCKSLRILKHTINDCDRLINCLSIKQKENTKAMIELFYLFSALSIEVRIGNIDEQALSERDDVYSKYLYGIYADTDESKNEINIKHPVAVLASKNRELRINSDLLTTSLLVNSLIKGFYDKNSISEAINKSHYFLPPTELPAWLVLMSFDEVEDERVEKAITTLKKQFKNREVHIYGEMLHLFCLRFLMSINKVINDNIDKVKIDCNKYIDDLLAMDKLPITDPSDFNTMIQDTSYGGHGYWITEEYTSQINEVRMYLKEKMNISLKNKYSQYKSEIINAMEYNGGEFRRLICDSYQGAGKFSRIDVLASIPVTEFVNAWLSGPNANWQVISISLKLRYDAGQLDGSLTNEKEWIMHVKEELELRSKAVAGFKRYRIERLISTAFRR